MSALALLLVVYTLTDVRYRFRIEVAPLPLHRVTFIALIVIGLMTLFTDVWLRERWLVLATSVMTISLWQALWALAFMAVAFLWLYFAFVRPPIFGRANAFRYGRAVYRRILKSSDTELPVIADELSYSAKSLLSALQVPIRVQIRQDALFENRKVAELAAQVLLMLGDRRLCRHMVAAASGTAVEFFTEAGRGLAQRNMTYIDLPLGPFAKSISTEAIANKDSSLYHEREGFDTGYFGYTKPFTEAVYGDIALVESLGDGFDSPLDVNYVDSRGWDSLQFEAYCRAALATFKAYVKRQQSLEYVPHLINRAIHTIQIGTNDLYMLDVGDSQFYSSDTFKRFRAAIEFAEKMITAIDDQPDRILGPLVESPTRAGQISACQAIAEFASELIFMATSIKADESTCWMIQHNTVWVAFFDFHDSGTWKNVRFKLRRMLYDEVLVFNRFPSFKAAKILGFCLNVMGFIGAEGIDREYRALRKVVLKWTRKNYLKLMRDYPDVARACLIGGISFDEKGRRLVKTYAKGVTSEPDRHYLTLDEPPNAEAPQSSTVKGVMG